jgi:hypothetical protein
MNQEDIIEFDRPTRGSKDGYLQLYFISRQQLGRIISDPSQSSTDGRIVTYTKFLISSITDDEIRDTVRKKYLKTIEDINNENYDNDIRHEKIIDACMEVLGDINAFYDEFLGISHRLKVGLG